MNRLGAPLALLLLPALASAAAAGEPFRMGEALLCTVERSSVPGGAGKRLLLAGLDSPAPKAVFENHIRAALSRIFDSDEILVLQLVAAVSGSVDTFLVDKAAGRFVHVSAGIFPVEVHAAAETGICRPVDPDAPFP
ncbi:MAG: hypothetical protein WHT06_01825 [Desulfobacterales bacterium]